MKTIGDLIDSLLSSKKLCMSSLEEVCENTPPHNLRDFKSLAIDKNNLVLFCSIVRDRIRQRLKSASSDEYYNLVKMEGEEFFQEVWDRVKEMNIPRKAVCIPISYVEEIVQWGVVKIKDGLVSVTAGGRAIVEKIKKSLGPS